MDFTPVSAHSFSPDDTQDFAPDDTQDFAPNESAAAQRKQRSSAPPVKPGQVALGKYRIQRVLGQGGMGFVVEATHIQQRKTVALKFLHAEANADEKTRARFLREARAAVQIESPYIARAIEVDQLDAHTPFIVMEYLDGETLDVTLEARGPLSVSEALPLVLQVCSALIAAHRLGIIHRDLKPSNLFVTRQPDGAPHIKVIDFGISKFMDEDGPSLTETSLVMGSPAYMSPEQMRSLKSADSRTDIWSLGVICYELLSGERPFKGALTDLLSKILNTEPVPLHACAQGVSSDLSQVIHRCLEKNVDDRYADVIEFTAALAPFASAQYTPLIPEGGATSAPQTEGAPTTRRDDDPPIRDEGATRDEPQRVHLTAELILSSVFSDDIFASPSDASAKPPAAPSSSPDQENASLPQLERDVQLLNRLGRGGMGEVYLAKDKHLNREFAIKVLTDQCQAQDHNRVRFLREAQVTAQLSHPNIIPVYSLEKTDLARPALTMKLVRGGTFQDYIAECRSRIKTSQLDPTTYGVGVRIEHFLKVCDAIAYSHDCGVIHRDIKPANLMLGAFHEVYVMDWGMARLVDEQPEASGVGEDKIVKTDLEDEDIAQTLAGTLVGTPMYFAPEQVQSPGEPRLSSDQYALGLVLFELLALEPARDPTKAVVEVLVEALEGGRRSFAELGKDKDVPLALQAITNRATAADPTLRYESVSAFAEDLRRYQRGEETHALPDNLPRRAWRTLQRHPVGTLIALVVLLLLAAAITTLSLSRSLSAEREALARQHHLSELASNITLRAQKIDRSFFNTERQLEGISSTLREMLLRPPTETNAAVFLPPAIASMEAPTRAKKSERYHQNISILHSNYWITPGSDAQSLHALAVSLKPLDEHMHDAFFDGALDVEADPDRAFAVLEDGTPLTWIYFGLENGLLINYPGNSEYPSDFDARKRPWYTQSRGRHQPHWSDPFPDASGTGFLVSCDRALYGKNNQFLGVIGMGMSMDHIIETMQAQGLPGVQDVFLMNSEGRVVVSASEQGQRSRVSTAGNRHKTLQSVGVPELAAAARAQTTSGFVHDGEHLYVFEHLQARPWTLVIHLDARENHF